MALGLVLSSPSGAVNSGDTVSLRISVENLRNTRGLVRVALFATEAGYPEQIDKAVLTRSTRPQGTQLDLRLEGLGAGRYALALLHDENENGRLDRNLLGIPTEGIGASGDAVRKTGKPRFADARITLERGSQSITIRVHYYL